MMPIKEREISAIITGNIFFMLSAKITGRMQGFNLSIRELRF